MVSLGREPDRVDDLRGDLVSITYTEPGSFIVLINAEPQPENCVKTANTRFRPEYRVLSRFVPSGRQIISPVSDKGDCPCGILRIRR